MLQPTRPFGDQEASYRRNGAWSGELLTSWQPAPDPDAALVVDGPTTLTYGQADRRRRAFAAALAGRGIGAGAVVTIELPNWWETVVAIHGCLLAGAVVNPVVPIYRDAELGFICRQAATAVIVVPHRFRGYDFAALALRVAATCAEAPLVVVVRPDGPLPDGCVSFDDLIAEAPPPDLEPATAAPVLAGIDADDICLLLYTSGTTADPKGVLHSHNTLAHEVRSIVELFALDGTDTVFMPSPLTHITGFLFGVLMPPLLGSGAVLLDVWEPKVATDLIETYRCRFTMAATPFLQGLLDTYRERGEPSALRVFACGGADVPPALVRHSRRALDTAVVRIYGSSEFPTFSSSSAADGEDQAADTDGVPIGWAQCRLEGAGELVVRGPELFLGYLDPSLNAAAFADGWFHTGDLASRSGEAIVIEGRAKDIIIRGGENLSAAQIEANLYDHPAVAEVAVVAMPDEAMGEKACAFVVAQGEAPDVATLAAWLEGKGLARQKFPERVEIIDQLPKTPSGKVQKFLLRQQAAALVAAEAAGEPRAEMEAL